MKSLIVNFLGGPGVSKSTTAAHVFAELKWIGINCELVPEYAKEKVWEKAFHALKNQRLVYGKQHQMIVRAAENVDVVLTDSPLLLSAIYAPSDEKLFLDLVVSDFIKMNNLNFLLIRKKEYVQVGRMQNKEEAIEKDNKIRYLLDINSISYTEFAGERDSVSLIVDYILDYYTKFLETYLSNLEKNHVRKI